MMVQINRAGERECDTGEIMGLKSWYTSSDSKYIQVSDYAIDGPGNLTFSSLLNII